MVPLLLKKIVPCRFLPLPYLTRLAVSKTKLCVRQGPFKGMRYVRSAQGSCYIPKLLGIYERELVPQIEALIARNPRLVIDAGAAEGYYAIGLATRLPQARIVCYESEPKGRELLAEMARLNGVSDRVEIHGHCDPRNLAEALSQDSESALICDVEGYEEMLLNPEMIPALIHTMILVEVHEFLVPGLTSTLTKRFECSHEISVIRQELRSTADYPWRTLLSRLLPIRYLERAVSEGRPCLMEWLWMKP